MSVRQPRTTDFDQGTTTLDFGDSQYDNRTAYAKQAASRAILDIQAIYSKLYQSEAKRATFEQPEETRSLPTVDPKQREYALKRMGFIQNSLISISGKIRFSKVPQELASKIARPLEVLKAQLEKSSEDKNWIWSLDQGSPLDMQFSEMISVVNDLERRIDSIINIQPSGLCGSSSVYKSGYTALAVSCERFMYTAEMFACFFTLTALAPAEIIVTRKEKTVVPMNFESTKEQLKKYLEDVISSSPEIVKVREVPVYSVAEGPKKSVVTNQEAKPKLDSFIMGQNFFYGYGYPQNKTKAVSLFETAAEKDHCSEAAVFLGKMYLDGDGVIQSDHEAFKWFNLAGSLGNTTGIYWEAFMYEKGRGLSGPTIINSESHASNMMKADQLYRDAASGLDGRGQPNPDALFALAKLRDVSRPTFDTEVVQLLEAAESLGNLDATNMLGEMYAEGRVPGTSSEMSQRKAVEMITAAAKKGHTQAQTNLGKLLVQGYANNKSFSDAKIWLERASKKFDPEAMFLLGYITYMEAMSSKDEKEMRKANMWFRHVLAVNPRHDDALYYLADMLENGRGGSKDLVLAAENYKACIEHNPNHSKALYKLGRIYLEGKGVAHSDKHLALEYIQASARLGNSNAMLYLGNLFSEDGVVAKDLAKSMKFYTEAVRNGNAEAKLKQAELIRKAPYMFSAMSDADTLARQAAGRGYIAANL